MTGPKVERTPRQTRAGKLKLIEGGRGAGTCLQMQGAHNLQHSTEASLDVTEARIRQLEESLHRKHPGLSLSSPVRIGGRAVPIPAPGALIQPPPRRTFSPSEELEVATLQRLQEQSKERLRQVEQSIQNHEQQRTSPRRISGEQQQLLSRLQALQQDVLSGRISATDLRSKLAMDAIRGPSTSPPPRRSLPPAYPPTIPPPPPGSASAALVAVSQSPSRQPSRVPGASPALVDPEMEAAVATRVTELLNRARLKVKMGIETPYPSAPPPPASPRPDPAASPERFRRPLSPGGPAPLSGEAYSKDLLAADGMLEVRNAGRQKSGPDADPASWLAWHRRDLPSVQRTDQDSYGSPSRAPLPTSAAGSPRSNS
eukprot:Hpha_TRINITY_DN15416_c1_g12::TRINITY_DN15416_c1_g12_i1::g.177044::m.177044